MSKSITIMDRDYIQWIKELSSRFRRSQIKAAVKVNQEMLRFYWELGRDIVEKKAESRWGSGFMKNLSKDLKEANPGATCFSQTNLLYMKNFYLLYHPFVENNNDVIKGTDELEFAPQVVDESHSELNSPQVVERLERDIFSVPWGHHRYIIDKLSNNQEKNFNA